MEQLTVKLIFPFASVNAESLPLLLSKYTNNFNIANFCAESDIGINKITFAVVDLPSDVVPKLFNDGVINDVDLIADNSVKCASDRKCSNGKCCK